MPEVESIVQAAPYVAEFLGTYTLTFAGGWCLLGQQEAWGVTAVGCMVAALVYALAPISGAHLNPAVSACVALSGKAQARVSVVLGYMCAQMCAGALAGLCLYMLPGFETSAKGVSEAPAGWALASFAEAAYTCLLCFVLLNACCAQANRGNQFYGIAVGFAVIAGGYAAGGAATFNPAMSAGFDVALRNRDAGLMLCRTLAEFAGAAAAAGLFRLVRPDEAGGEPSGTLARFLSEFVGSFYFTLTVILGLITESVSLVPSTAWAATASIACLTYSLASVSGANFNPAVSLGIFLGGREKLGLMEFIAYAALQLTAGAAAGALVGALGSADSLPQEALRGGPHRAACAAELLFTSALVFSVLCVATRALSWQSARNHFGLAIACSATAGIVGLGSASGGALNPATALGIAAARLSYDVFALHVRRAGLWALCQLLGAALAAGLFRVLYFREYDESFLMSMGRGNPGAAEVGAMVGNNEKPEGSSRYCGVNQQSTFAFNRQRTCRVCTG